jgi:hypothetical protein
MRANQALLLLRRARREVTQVELNPEGQDDDAEEVGRNHIAESVGTYVHAGWANAHDLAAGEHDGHRAPEGSGQPRHGEEEQKAEEDRYRT